jgi:hypothetical protein
MVSGVMTEPDTRELAQGAKPVIPVIIQSPDGLPPPQLRDPAYTEFIDSFDKKDADKAPVALAEKPSQLATAIAPDDAIKSYLAAIATAAPAAALPAGKISLQQPAPAIQAFLPVQNMGPTPDMADPDSDTTSIRTLGKVIARTGKGKLNPNDLDGQEESERSADQNDTFFEEIELEVYLEDQIRDTSERIAQYDEELRKTRQEEFRQQEHLNELNEQTAQLKKEETLLTDEQTTITNKIGEKGRTLQASEQEEADTAKAFDQKYKEIYPNGRGGGYETNAIETADEKLRLDAWAKHRDEIAAQYMQAGLTQQEFEAMERSINGQPSQPGDNVGAAANKARAAGLSGNLYVALTENLKKTDPDNAYLNTLDARSVDHQKALEDNTKARTEYFASQNEDVSQKLRNINTRLTDIETERKALADQKDVSEKALAKLKATEDALTEQRKAAVEYQKWLEDPKTRERIKDGTIKLDDFKAEQEKTGYNNGGTGNTKTADASWSTTSNAGSTIQAAAPVGEHFANAVTPPPEEAAAPAPAPQPVLAPNAPWQQRLG